MFPIMLGVAALTLGHCLPAHTAPKPTPPAPKPTVRQVVDELPADTRITYQAAAVYVASSIYMEAVKADDPAATLDDVADALPDTMARVFATVGTDPEFLEVMRPVVVDHIWAYGVIEHARTTWDPGYRYVLDVLADGLKRGADPAAVRADVRRIADQLATSGGVA